MLRKWLGLLIQFKNSSYIWYRPTSELLFSTCVVYSHLRSLHLRHLTSCSMSISWCFCHRTARPRAFSNLYIYCSFHFVINYYGICYFKFLLSETTKRHFYDKNIQTSVLTLGGRIGLYMHACAGLFPRKFTDRTTETETAMLKNQNRTDFIKNSTEKPKL